MVVTLAPAIAASVVMQDRVARPSTCTVQAPHMPIPQPNFVPVRPSSSRIAQSRGVSSGLVTETVRPLRSNVVMIQLPTSFALGDDGLPAHGSNLLVHIGPGRKVHAGATQIGG